MIIETDNGDISFQFDNIQVDLMRIGSNFYKLSASSLSDQEAFSSGLDLTARDMTQHIQSWMHCVDGKQAVNLIQFFTVTGRPDYVHSLDIFPFSNDCVMRITYNVLEDEYVELNNIPVLTVKTIDDLISYSDVSEMFQIMLEHMQIHQ